MDVERRRKKNSFPGSLCLGTQMSEALPQFSDIRITH